MVKARKRFGQHFLSDQGVLNAMATTIALRDGDAVLEIGPGRGALTDVLMGVGERYAAVELDRDLAPVLRARYPQLQLVSEDILKTDLQALTTGREGWRVVGNLPYNISSPLIMRFAHFCHAQPGRVADLHFMLQLEMAQRLAAELGTKAWGRLGVMTQLLFDVELLFEVEPSSFTPPPKVMSAVVRLLPRAVEIDGETMTALDRVLRVAFAGRRKTLTNALRTLELDWARLPIDPSLRAERVDVAGFIAIAEQVGSG